MAPPAGTASAGPQKLKARGVPTGFRVQHPTVEFRVEVEERASHGDSSTCKATSQIQRCTCRFRDTTVKFESCGLNDECSGFYIFGAGTLRLVPEGTWLPDGCGQDLRKWFLPRRTTVAVAGCPTTLVSLRLQKHINRSVLIL